MKSLLFDLEHWDFMGQNGQIITDKVETYVDAEAHTDSATMQQWFDNNCGQLIAKAAKELDVGYVDSAYIALNIWPQ